MIDLRPASPEDFDFAFRVKKQAMGDHIRAKWAWDETFQLGLHTTSWNQKLWFVIQMDETDIGTVSLHEMNKNTLRFGEFYLLDEFRNNGLGTVLLGRILKASDHRDQTVILEVLKWNPVRSLYERHGFSIISEKRNSLFHGAKADRMSRPARGRQRTVLTLLT